MTRLFIRFYVSVIAILAIALGIGFFASQFRFDTDFDAIANRETQGGFRRAKERIASSDEAIREKIVDLLQSELGYPVGIVGEKDLQHVVQDWLIQKSDITVHVDNNLFVLLPIQGSTSALQLGPIPVGRGHVELDMILAMSGVLLLVAIAIAILLRPLATHLRILEQAAIAIADGDLKARVDLSQINGTDSARTLAQAFNEMAIRVESLLRTQKELLQAVSHELRTPLTRIQFAIDLIRSSNEETEKQRRLKSLDTAAMEMDELLTELLCYVRLENDQPQPTHDSLDLLPVVQEAIENLSIQRNSIKFEIGPNLLEKSICLVADQIGVTRVLNNLLSNASKHASSRVWVDASNTRAGITLEVDDDGPGIPDTDCIRVFEPFVRLEEGGQGVGLGLAIVKRIVGNHGGTVSALRGSTGGCKIRIYWPQ